jgi:hypothetical protein
MEDRMQNIASYFRPALATLVLFAGAIGLAPGAHAEILSISGAAFVQQCPCSPSGNLPDVNNGLLVPTDQSNLYAAVDFPTNGQKICSLSLVYQDTNANDTMTARLFRKAFAVGSNPLNNPTVILTAKSAAGVVSTVRRTTTKTATPPTINDGTGFYFVEVSVPTVNLNFLGVQIDYRPTCP